MSNTTPGPWNGHKSVNAHDQGLVVAETTGANVAVVYNGEADTTLIATAPDLLKALKTTTQALKDILSAADNGQPYTPAELEKEFLGDYNAGYEAIRKAEGE